MKAPRFALTAAPAAACIAAALAVGPSSARADDPARRSQHYVIVGELSERDINQYWAPARRAARVRLGESSARAESQSDRVALEEWVPDEAAPRRGARLREQEERMKLLRGMVDTYPDYVSHAIDSRSIVPKFWW